MKDKLLNPNQVAGYIGVNAASVRHWLRSGQIEGRRINGRWRVKKSELNAIFPDGPPRNREEYAGLIDRWETLSHPFLIHGGNATLREIILDLAFIEDVFPYGPGSDEDGKDGNEATMHVNIMASELRLLLENILGWRYESTTDEGSVKWSVANRDLDLTFRAFPVLSK